MKRKKTRLSVSALLASMLVVISGCAGIMYHPLTVTHAQNIDIQIDALTAKAANDNYFNDATLINQLNDSLTAALAYEKGRGKTNFATINMWKLVVTNVDSAFLPLWKKENKVKPVFASDYSHAIDTIFTHIIYLEKNKETGPLHQKTN